MTRQTSQIPTPYVVHDETTGRTYVRVMTERQCAKALSLSLQQLRRMRIKGESPRSVRLSTRRIGYRETDVFDWLAARVEGAEQ